MHALLVAASLALSPRARETAACVLWLISVASDLRVAGQDERGVAAVPMLESIREDSSGNRTHYDSVYEVLAMSIRSASLLDVTRLASRKA
jgi:hypothetical protein